MNHRGSLVLLAAGSAALTAVLSLTAASAAQALAATAPTWWGPSHLASAVVALTCGLGGLGAMWHTASALLALIALRGTGTGALPGRASRSAARVLGRWGAPLVRRAAAGALAASIVAAPAYAAQASPSTEDLGWRATSSVPQTSPAEPTTPTPDAPSSWEDPAPADTSAVHPDGPTHTVAPGESLWSITAQHLPAGSSTAAVAAAWPAVHDANRPTIGADPTTLRPGTVLTIPQDLSRAPDQEGP